MSAIGPVRATTADKTSLVWETPPAFFAWRESIWHFDVDAAANEANCLAPRHFGPGSYYANDALAPDLDWSDHGDRFWCNPPYGDGVMTWCRTFAWQAGNVFIEALLPANTGTKWFAYCRETAAEIELLTGRLQFLIDGKPGKNTNTSDSMLVRWRPSVTGGATIRLTDWKEAMG